MLATYGNYLHHQPQTITDAAGKVTTLHYNARGQVDWIVNPKLERTDITYEELTSAPAYGRPLQTGSVCETHFFSYRRGRLLSLGALVAVGLFGVALLVRRVRQARRVS